jgi:hypothetical protein
VRFKAVLQAKISVSVLKGGNSELTVPGGNMGVPVLLGEGSEKLEVNIVVIDEQ